jgi:phosphoribosylformimino-5-aminoimidazole carboxamide ribotide isomerase
MEFYAAIDILEGGAVRLFQGDYDQSTTYGDARGLAEEFIVGGADWLHLVDLDGARDGTSTNRRLIQEIVASSPLPVEVGGGIRSVADADALLSAGAQRVILGTIAIEDPMLASQICATFPGHVAVGLDYRRRNGEYVVAVRGWREDATQSLLEVVARLEVDEVGAIVLTAIDRDGTLEGPDVAGLANVLGATEIAVVASAGVGSLEDLRTLREIVDPASQRRLSGVVVGKALVEGAFSVAEGVRTCR